MPAAHRIQRVAPLPVAGILLLLYAQPADGAAEPRARYAGRRPRGPLSAASFDGLMGARLVADAPAIAAAYPWGTLGHVVDVGGGNGTLLIAILRAHDDLRGTVIDLAGPVPAPSKPSPPPAWATGPAPRPAASSTPFPRERAATSSRASCMTGMMRMHVAS